MVETRASDGRIALVAVDQSGLSNSDEILRRLNHSVTDHADALPFIHIFAADGDNRGVWTMLPLFTRSQRLHYFTFVDLCMIDFDFDFDSFRLTSVPIRLPQLDSNVTWILFLTENTRLNWPHLIQLTRQFDPAKVSKS